MEGFIILLHTRWVRAAAVIAACLFVSMNDDQESSSFEVSARQEGIGQSEDIDRMDLRGRSALNMGNAGRGF